MIRPLRLRPEHRLVPTAVVCWLTALVVVAGPDVAVPTAAGLAVGAISALIGVLRGRRHLVLAVVALGAAVVVAGSIAAHAPGRAPVELASATGPVH